MNIEEKARAYDKAIEKIKYVMEHGVSPVLNKEDLQDIFPELKESEDEKIRKWLEETIEGMPENSIDFRDVRRIDVLHWLEKQGGQKSIDDLTQQEAMDIAVAKCFEQEKQKPAFDFNVVDWQPSKVDGKIHNIYNSEVEPKFKVGNWYQCTKDFFGKGVTFDKNTAYYCAKEGCLQNEYGCHIAIVKDLYDNFKLWTIADAEDGDILAFKDSTSGVLIYKDYINTVSGVLSYCRTVRDRFISKEESGWGPTLLFPATKEQRNYLFEKMHEAGYEWNKEKKELRKIEKQDEKPADTKIMWHDVSEEPEEMKELLVEWDSEDATWHEVAFYHADTKTFWDGERQVKNVTRWCYIDDILEKQGEQKLVDKVEPKFKVGDWITDGYLHCKISDVLDDRYIVDTKFAKRSAISFKCKDNYHLWTIQDAKDGDVLASNKSIFIFQEEYICEKPTAYCGLMNGLFIEGKGACWTNEKCYPATKEQRDTLFAKMKEAGYEWDAEKKELRMIEKQSEQKPQRMVSAEAKESLYDKPKWSEEDDAYVFGIVRYLKEAVPYSGGDWIIWLESLKKRME